MPQSFPPPIDRFTIIPGPKYEVRGWALVVIVECQTCKPGESFVQVLAGSDAICPHCRTTFRVGGLRWDESTPMPPQFKIGAFEPLPLS